MSEPKSPREFDVNAVNETSDKYANEDHDWHSCNGVSLAPVRRKAFSVGARWQFNQLAAELDAQAAEIARLKVYAAAVKDETERLHNGWIDAASERDRLQRQVEVLKLALEFYASPNHWQHGIAYSQNNLMIESDMYCLSGHHLYAGKAAKDALAEWEKLWSEK